MPLKMGGVETERAQLIVYDPTVAAEVKEALARRTTLLAQGFQLKTEDAGRIELEPPPRADHIGVLRVLSPNGDDRLVWDRRDPSQVKEAFRKFKEFIAKGFTAYAVLATGKRGHKLTEFDPGLQEILLRKGEIVMVPATMPG